MRSLLEHGTHLRDKSSVLKSNILASGFGVERIDRVGMAGQLGDLMDEGMADGGGRRGKRREEKEKKEGSVRPAFV